ncbi:MAG: amidohydrolase family protein [Patescibacteria group bacterium]
MKDKGNNFLKIPGLIDIHVHLRDPGQTYKEDFSTGTSAALAGGITALFDMPNNPEPIFSSKKLEEKKQIARSKAVCDWGLYFGSDGNNTEEFNKASEKTVGLKIYLNATTGKYNIRDGKLIEKIFQKWPKTKVIVVHAEGDKIDLAINLCRIYNSQIHITHISRKEDLEKILAAKKQKLNITCDITPHHLFLTKEDLIALKGYGQVKPPLPTREDQTFLWENIAGIDCIASDHAPHTIAEKESQNPPFGIPGLETMLPLLMIAVRDGRLTIDDIIRLTNINPQKIFNFRQSDNTCIEIDTGNKYVIDNNNLKTKCAWSPFAGWEVYGKVKRVFIRGVKVFEDGEVLTRPGFGQDVTGL